MYLVILIAHVVVCISLVTLIMLQHGKGADAGVAFSSSSISGDTKNLGMAAYEESVWMYDEASKQYLNKSGYFLDDLKESLPLLKSSLKSIYNKIKKFKQFDAFGNPM